jgi:DNA-binding response OmpR family regulator
MVEDRMKKRVMIVDDEIEVRETVVRHLGRNGIEAVGASGYEECLAHLKGGFEGLIFMDLMMPKKDGWDTIREVVKHEYGKNVSFILLTASVDPTPHKSEGLLQYVVDYIRKPTNLEDIVAAAKKYLTPDQD